MNDATNDRLAIGGNYAPTDPELLKDYLATQHAAMVADKQNRLDDAAALPPTVDTEEQLKAASDVVKDIQIVMKRAEATREAAKAPFLNGGRVIDGFFKGIAAPLDEARRRVEARMGIFLRAKQARERALAEEAARREREQADRLAAAAAESERQRQEQEAARRAAIEAGNMRDAPKVAEPKALAGEMIHQALEAEGEARRQEIRATAKPAELARTRSDSGVVSTLAREWKFRVITESAVPREFLVVDETLIRAKVRDAVRSKTIGDLRIAGVEIYQQDVTKVI